MVIHLKFAKKFHLNVKFSQGPSASQVRKSEDIQKSMGRIKKIMYTFFVALSASYLMVIISVNNYWPFVSYTFVFCKKSPKNDQKITMWP